MTVEERPGPRAFVTYFNPPVGKGDPIICHRFPKLGWAVGCPYSCDFCYLWLTLRTQRQVRLSDFEGERPGLSLEQTCYYHHPMIVWTDYGKMARDVQRWAAAEKRSFPGEYLNAGELADALAFGDYSRRMIETVRPYLREGRGLYLLTKSTARVLDGLSPDPNIIVAFSVNAPMATALYEKGTPTVYQRIGAALSLRDKGWRVRIRLDPMLPIEGWEKDYEKVIEWINSVKPERVTLGSLRASATLPAQAPPSDLWELLTERAVGGKRHLGEEVTTELYRFASDRLECPAVSLCKESKAMWERVGLSLKYGLRCCCLE